MTETRCRFRKIVVGAMVLLLAGAVVNIGVASVCAMFSGAQVIPYVHKPDERDQQFWQRHRETRSPEQPKAVWFYRGIGLEARMMLGERVGQSWFAESGDQVTFGAFANTLFDSLQDVQCGWPMPALSGFIWHYDMTLSGATPVVGRPNPSVWNDTLRRQVVELDRSEWLGGSSYRLLPYGPIWHGFAINTLFYAAILWTLLFLALPVRRHLRVRRGLCAACAYPIGTSPVCTECGQPLPGKTA